MFQKIGPVEIQEYLGKKVVGTKKKTVFVDPLNPRETSQLGGTLMVIFWCVFVFSMSYLFLTDLASDPRLNIFILLLAFWLISLLTLAVIAPTALKEVNVYGNKKVPWIVVKWSDGVHSFKNDMEKSVFQRLQNTTIAVKFYKRSRVYLDNAANFNYWYYKGYIWKEDEDYNGDEVLAIVKHEEKKRKERIDTAKKALGREKVVAELKDIPLPFNDFMNECQISRDVMEKVWLRDGGKCAKCRGVNLPQLINLDFHPIIPFRDGGENTEQNIQLLCNFCSRQQ